MKSSLEGSSSEGTGRALAAGAPAPQPNPAGTILLLVALAIASVGFDAATPTDLARSSAIIVGIGLALSIVMDCLHGLHNLLRTDLFALLALYFLTLTEFLVPQPGFDMLVATEEMRAAIFAVLCGIGGFAVGRHLRVGRQLPFTGLFTVPIPQKWLAGTCWFCFAAGFFYIFLTVDFNPVKVVQHMMEPRFTQPWSRERLGDWRALLSEMVLFLYLVPPIAGVIVARRHACSKSALVQACLAFAFVLFYGFASGTRNLFASYLVTFLIAHAIASPPQRKREIIALMGVAAALLIFATVVMLEMRKQGLTEYLSKGEDKGDELGLPALMIDLNLYNIAQIVQVFPGQIGYLGLEVPYVALIRPIPRALWPGKPEGLSVSMEEALGGDQSWTMAATFVGEAYMAGGNLAVLVVAVILGMMTAWWNRFGSSGNSDLGVLVYASGFFAAVITMRSLFTLTTAILPTLAGIFIGAYLITKIRRTRNHAARTPPSHQPQASDGIGSRRQIPG